MLDDLMRQLEALRAKQLRWIADQDPTLAKLKQALEKERAIQQMDVRALAAFIADLEARFAEDNGQAPDHEDG